MPLAFAFGDQNRESLLFAPEQWMQFTLSQPFGTRKFPLVVMLHDAPGFSPQNVSTARGFANIAAMQDISTAGFLPPGSVVPLEDFFFTLYISGLALGSTNGNTQPQNGWNSGHMFPPATIAGADDVAYITDSVLQAKAFLRNAIDRVTGVRPVVIDNGRRFIVGMGNGGEMAYRMLAETSLFRGGAVVGGTIGGRLSGTLTPSVFHAPTGASSNVRGIFHIHGRTDAEADWAEPALGGVSSEVASPNDNARVANQNAAFPTADISRRDRLPVAAMDAWVQYMKPQPPTTFAIPGFTTLAQQNSGVAARQWEWTPATNRLVRLWRLNLNHRWPIAGSNGNWNGAEEIWSFFKSL